MMSREALISGQDADPAVVTPLVDNSASLGHQSGCAALQAAIFAIVEKRVEAG